MRKRNTNPETFRNDFKNFLKQVCSYLIDGGDIPVSDISCRKKIIEQADLAVVTIWNSILADGRVMVFMDDDNLDWFAKLAELNVRIFGRGTTLNERLMNFSSNRNFNDVFFQINLVDRGGAEIDCTVDRQHDAVYFKISKRIWNDLGALTHREGYKNERIEMLLTGAEGAFDIDDVARAMKNNFGSILKDSRLEAIVGRWSEIFRSSNEKDFFKALHYLSDIEDVNRHRKEEGFPPVPKPDNIMGDTSYLSLGRDFKIVDEFISFLQALAHYFPEVRTIIGLCDAQKPVDDEKAPDVGGSIVLFSSEDLSLSQNDRKKIIKVLSNLYGSVNQNQIKWQRKLPQKDKPVGRFNRDLDELRDGELKETIEEELKHHPTMDNLLDLANSLSTKIHEGRNLAFTFLYGGGTSWRIIESVLSKEFIGADYATFSISDFSNLFNDHWSIFQGERVVGYIDGIKALSPIFEGDMPPFTQVVKLKPLALTPGPLFSQCTKISPDSIIVNASGNKVRVFLKGNEIFEWNTATGKIEKVKPDPEMLTNNIMQILKLDSDPKEATPPGKLLENIKGIKEMFKNVIEEISETRGEGTLLIVAPVDLIGTLISQMDKEKKMMAWRRKKAIKFLDKDILRAMMILDGATLLSVDEKNKNISVATRFTVAPHCSICASPHSFSVISLPKECSYMNDLSNLKNLQILDGRGSKHHNAANLSVLLWLQRGKTIDDFRVITISADGPIKEWPTQIL